MMYLKVRGCGAAPSLVAAYGAAQSHPLHAVPRMLSRALSTQSMQQVFHRSFKIM